ncbi:hypothetical protein Q5752_001104 [Cryptotrichosporon argae]
MVVPQLVAIALALSAPVLGAYQPKHKRDSSSQVAVLSFESVGDAGISAQQMFVGNKDKVYIIDKTENNPVTIDGEYGTHPAWAVEYDVNTNTYRAMDVYSNTFCAGGGVLGNGTWAVFGGNKPVTTNGTATTTAGVYDDTDGGTAIRMITPCDDETCQYVQGAQTYNISDDTGGYLQMTSKRWYPMVEALEDGSLIVIGGDINGGYVNTAAQDNPTYEFFPAKGDGEAVTLQFLSDTLPVNLYPLTWLMPSGLLFMQSGNGSILLNYTSNDVTYLPNMPYAIRVYPASAATAMLPLTPANNYTATVLFCGGSNTTEWGSDGGSGYNVTAVPADQTCVRISPDDANPEYTDDDDFPEGRSMGQFVILPDATMWMGNGVAMGTAGYGDEGWSVGQSYGQDPIYMPAIYNYSAPAGQRWNRTGLTASTNERMYHSTAVLLADGSILVSGSNPNKDFTDLQWRTRTDTERWYPWYYLEDRPTYSGAPTNLSYGGDAFDIQLNTTDEATVRATKAVVIRNGFNTHAIAFGQRYLELETSYTIDPATGNTTLHVSQMPGNPGPTLFQPGPAMFFIVINGVPSEAEFVMVGSGELGTQPTAANAALPSNTVLTVTSTSPSAGTSSTSGTDSSSGSGSGSTSSAVKLTLGAGSRAVPAAAAVLAVALGAALL